MDSTLLLEDTYQSAVRRAHERLAGPSETSLRLPSSGPGVRASVLESWDRSLTRLRDPDSVQVQVAFETDRLAEVRRRHPFHAIMPLLRSHLIEPAKDAGLLAALGDEQGRLLWVEGERGVRNRAEAMGFVSGSDWSEDSEGEVGRLIDTFRIAAEESVRMTGEVQPLDITARARGRPGSTASTTRP